MQRRTAIPWGLGAVQLAAAAFAYVAMVAIVLDTPHVWLRLGLLASLVVAVFGVVGCLLQNVVPAFQQDCCRPEPAPAGFRNNNPVSHLGPEGRMRPSPGPAYGIRLPRSTIQDQA